MTCMRRVMWKEELLSLDGKMVTSARCGVCTVCTSPIVTLRRSAIAEYADLKSKREADPVFLRLIAAATHV